MLIWILAATVGCWLGLGMLALCACILGARAEARAERLARAEQQQQTGNQSRRSVARVAVL
jgi:hypothetical protein